MYLKNNQLTETGEYMKNYRGGRRSRPSVNSTMRKLKPWLYLAEQGMLAGAYFVRGLQDMPELAEPPTATDKIISVLSQVLED